MDQNKTKKRSIFSWGIDESDLRNQIDNYDTLKITQSYRGISVLITAVLLGISLLLGFFEIIPVTDILYSLIIYVPILIFVYKGHRWAIISLMILWTFEKGYSLLTGAGIMAIIWWLIIMPYFYKALKVENEKRKLPANNTNTDKRFCSHCGSAIDADAKFCTSCGKSI